MTAAGTAPLGYQWQFSGTNLAGATGSSLTLSNVQPAQAGNYAVQVTNAYGLAISSNALLTLNHAPIADASATPAPVIAPLQGPARVALDGSRSFDPDGDPLVFSWFLGGEEIATGVVAVVPLPGDCKHRAGGG